MKLILVLALTGCFLVESEGNPNPLRSLYEVEITDRKDCVGDGRMCDSVHGGNCCQRGLFCDTKNKQSGMSFCRKKTESGCKCSDVTIQGYGNCETDYQTDARTGAGPICYISDDVKDNCSDKRYSKTAKWWYSWIACNN